MTPILFHGPVAREKAVAAAELAGRVVAEIGDNGLKVADSRTLVLLANQGSIGDRLPVAIVGPIDSATPEAADALLKTLEDLTDGPLQIILWTDHLSAVIPTIRSRTQHVWCPPKDPSGWDHLHAHMAVPAKKLTEAVLAGDLITVLSVLEEVSAKDGSGVKRIEPLLEAVTACLATEAVSRGVGFVFWDRLREALGSGWTDSRSAVASVFLGEG